uniref:Uncharacterized protein n=1 Tax=Rhizophagus irregularis (strain DAOM 181602 / DAOM 197198 / MUCL 43194) TaxID=747089 RepID=U9URS4_RHIID
MIRHSQARFFLELKDFSSSFSFLMQIHISNISLINIVRAWNHILYISLCNFYNIYLTAIKHRSAPVPNSLLFDSLIRILQKWYHQMPGGIASF